MTLDYYYCPTCQLVVTVGVDTATAIPVHYVDDPEVRQSHQLEVVSIAELFNRQAHRFQRELEKHAQRCQK